MIYRRLQFLSGCLRHEFNFTQASEKSQYPDTSEQNLNPALYLCASVVRVRHRRLLVYFHIRAGSLCPDITSDLLIQPDLRFRQVNPTSLQYSNIYQFNLDNLNLFIFN